MSYRFPAGNVKPLSPTLIGNVFLPLTTTTDTLGCERRHCETGSGREEVSEDRGRVTQSNTTTLIGMTGEEVKVSNIWEKADIRKVWQHPGILVAPGNIGGIREYWWHHRVLVASESIGGIRDCWWH